MWSVSPTLKKNYDIKKKGVCYDIFWLYHKIWRFTSEQKEKKNKKERYAITV